MKPYLWDDDVSQSPGQSEQIQRVLQPQGCIVYNIVLHAVVNVRYLADVIAAILHVEVSLELRPALQHQLQCLAMVQLQVCEWEREKDETERM